MSVPATADPLRARRCRHAGDGEVPAAASAPATATVSCNFLSIVPSSGRVSWLRSGPGYAQLQRRDHLGERHSGLLVDRHDVRR